MDEVTQDILTTGSRWRLWAHTTRHLSARSSPNSMESVSASRARETARNRRFAAFRMTWEELYPAQCNQLKQEAARYGQSLEPVRLVVGAGFGASGGSSRHWLSRAMNWSSSAVGQICNEPKQLRTQLGTDVEGASKARR
jgi:hypothetical protein